MRVNSIIYSYICAFLVFVGRHADHQLFTTAPLQTRGFGSGDVEERRRSQYRIFELHRIGANSGIGALNTGRWIVSADETRCMIAEAIFKLPTQQAPYIFIAQK